MSDALLIAIIGGCISLATAIIPKWMDNKNGIGKDIKEIKKDVLNLVKVNKMNSDMIYQMLDHLATDNNTGEMKRALDDYNNFFRQVKEG